MVGIMSAFCTKPLNLLTGFDAGHTDDERDVHQLFVRPWPAFSHNAMTVFVISHRLTVIRCDNKQGFIHQTFGIQGVKQFTYPFVGNRDFLHAQRAHVQPHVLLSGL